MKKIDSFLVSECFETGSRIKQVELVDHTLVEIGGKARALGLPERVLPLVAATLNQTFADQID